jgi:transcriptional regulator with GAF, ATPase, and Fis domain
MTPRMMEEASPAPERPARLLIHVLCYDDLLRPPARCYPLDGLPLPLSICRAEGPARGGALPLGDPFLSARHALILPGDVLRDEESRNGTFVNGRRVREHPLQDGDLIEVGHSLLCYRVVPGAMAALLAGPELPRLGPTATLCLEVAALAQDLQRIAPSDQPVLLLGETGSGKEVMAEVVHRLSGRGGPLLAVDCGAIPEALFESVLLGHRRGAFTGASEERIGEIVRADGGTLFLDEIGNLPVGCQPKLLRVLETRRVVPVGGTRGREVDVRLIAATNEDITGAGSGFRPDLLRRLAGYVAHLPPLRRRREDLGLLSAHLLAEAGVEKAVITGPAARALFLGDLPGNIRELRMQLRSAALLAAGRPIEPAHLAQLGSTAQARRGDLSAAAVAAALTETGGNVVRAAHALGTHPRQVYRLIERFNLDLASFRHPSRR